ncbi:polysaccharide lyase 8 family protein [bacterium]|nr:polysaccharide lyase 8 family protein [bacterium]
MKKARVLAYLLSIGAAVIMFGSLYSIPCYAQERSTVSSKEADRDMDTVRQRLLDPLLEKVDNEQVDGLVAAQKPDGTWEDVLYTDQNRANWATFKHLSYLLTLAQGYESPSSALRGDPKLRVAVFAGLDHWLGKDYQNPNWWWNVIGVPGRLAQVLLLIDGELDDTQRTKGVEILTRAKLGMTGANLADVGNITVMRGILENNPQVVSEALNRITGEIRISMEEGIQPDFSFHQHGALLYNHGYGAVFASNCSELATVVTGTRFEFPADKIGILNGLILDGCQWMIRCSTKDYGATGRGITRRQGTNPSAGYLRPIVENMLKIPTGRETGYRDLLARLEGGNTAPLTGNRHFWRGDIMTHHRPDYYASARMFSNRLLNTDNPANDEGLKSHHLADGCTYIMRTDWEYHDIFPVWDWQKIPGTTVELTPELAGKICIKGTRPFAGGVSDGMYGMAAFDFERDGLFARKAWFFFDDEFVCLGAGITCSSDNPVVTTVNQCFLKGDLTVSNGKDSRTVSRGSHSFTDAAWVYHDSTAYIFPEPAQLRLTNDAQTGDWWSINHMYSKENVSRDVCTVWFDHGKSPREARYAYIVSPGVSLASVARYEKGASPVEILSNEPEIQAVRHKGLGITGIAFYSPGSLRVAENLEIGAEKPCLLLVKELKDTIEISVSNPVNREMTVAVVVRRDGKSPMTVIFDLPGDMYAGKSVMQRVKL